MGHVLISCGSCHDELRSTTFYEPPHDIRHRQIGPRGVVLGHGWRPLLRRWRVSKQVSNNRHRR